MLSPPDAGLGRGAGTGRQAGRQAGREPAPGPLARRVHVWAAPQASWLRESHTERARFLKLLVPSTNDETTKPLLSEAMNSPALSDTGKGSFKQALYF